MKKDKCSYCYGYGFWPIGDLSPLGPIDSQDFTSIKCPWCEQGTVDKGDRYESLKKAKENEKK